ncbi:hypothetical protein B0A49_09384 [Cryomyces minteri]|uniref:HAT C-terminal dimerisation domain-containing protein n=1 Tax=Cryomyces minteri TaxID=331657 RepID=A0A4U0WE64_9PEZI|nr:hypothetical protein B0A49_12389 [Cryomyces minteri]TKA63592.1 hypothetical protein B0A49_09384 [Cryomyces minteri]
MLWETQYKDRIETASTETSEASQEPDEFGLIKRQLDSTVSTPDEYEDYIKANPIKTLCSPLSWWLQDAQLSWERMRLGAAVIEEGECLKSWIRSGITSGGEFSFVEGDGEDEDKGMNMWMETEFQFVNATVAAPGIPQEPAIRTMIRRQAMKDISLARQRNNTYGKHNLRQYPAFEQSNTGVGPIAEE